MMFSNNSRSSFVIPLILILFVFFLPQKSVALDISIINDLSVISTAQIGVNDEVGIQVYVSLVGELDLDTANYTVSVSASNTIITLDSISCGSVGPQNPNQYLCSFTVGIGPSDPSWGPHPLPPSTPYYQTVTNAGPMKVIVATVTSSTSFARTRGVLFDGRQITEETNGNVAINPQVVELTKTGFDGLKNTHEDPFPIESIHDFNNRLNNNLTDRDQSKSKVTDSKICFDIDTFDNISKIPSFLSVPAFQEISIVASTMYGAYRVAKNICATSAEPITKGIACGIEAASCVTNLPDNPSEYEICLEQVDGFMHSQNVDFLNDIELGLSSTDNEFEADFNFTNLVTKFDIDLKQDVVIRYKKQPINGNVCGIFPPNVHLDPTELTDNIDLKAWSECKNSETVVNQVCSSCGNTSDPAILGLETSNTNAETFNATAISNSSLSLVNISHNMPTGSTCTDPDVLLGVEALQELYLGEIRVNVEETWNDASLPKQYNNYVDDLLNPLEIGEISAVTAYTPISEIISIASNEISGVRAALTSNPDSNTATPRGTTVFRNGEPVVIPQHPAGVNPISNLGFDVSQSLTTFTINQIIAAQANATLNFNIEPTNAELGNGDLPADAPAFLDGFSLGSYFSVFNQIGNNVVTIHVNPQSIPFTWMIRDSGITTTPVFLYSPGLQVTISDGTTVWAKFYMDKYTDEIDINFSETSREFLDVATAAPTKKWEIFLTETAFVHPTTGLPCGPQNPFITPPLNSCGGQLEGALLTLVKPHIEDRVFSLLQQIPGPRYYDQGGSSFDTVVANTSDTNRQEESYITMFGVFEPYALTDSDNDGVPDGKDNCITIPNPSQGDADLDGLGNACDPDKDGDGFENNNDNCPNTFNDKQADTDSDGQGDLCDNDDDDDSIADNLDNCQRTVNPGQENMDAAFDDVGDACDHDSDNDGINDAFDNCPMTSNPDQVDSDNDGIGSECDNDNDDDGIPDAQDNCPFESNPDQTDSDNDGYGDSCDADKDGDGLIDTEDNCPTILNYNQNDFESDGLGNACDPDDDNDGMPDTWEKHYGFAFHNNSNAELDADGDGFTNLEEFNLGTNPRVDNALLNNALNRAEFAKEILLYKYGYDFVPPDATGLVYSDVDDTDFNSKWIEKLFSDGLTLGCATNSFCPQLIVTKEQVARTILRAKHGNSYLAPAAVGGVFDDIPSNHFVAKWIERLSVEGITEGCVANNFCPKQSVTIGMLSPMLERAAAAE